MIKLGLLTFDGGKNNNISEIFDLAVQADQLNFSRFWLGEHFNIRGLWNNPEPLLPLILGFTNNIRVGTAGILLRLHSPYRVASNFKLLNLLYGERVDLGLANGYSIDETIPRLTNLSKEEFLKIKFEDKFEELTSYYTKEEQYAEKGIFITPLGASTPPIWLLSLCFSKLNYALNFNTNYAVSLFHKNTRIKLETIDKIRVKDQITEYKELYFQKYQCFPCINIAFSGIYSKSYNKALKLYQSSPYADNPYYDCNIIGGIEQFEDYIYSYKNSLGIDEFCFFDMSSCMLQRIENIHSLSSLINQ